MRAPRFPRASVPRTNVASSGFIPPKSLASQGRNLTPANSATGRTTIPTSAGPGKMSADPFAPARIPGMPSRAQQDAQDMRHAARIARRQDAAEDNAFGGF